jgi:hypothetical protein
VCRVLNKAKAPDKLNKTWCVCSSCNWNDGVFVARSFSSYVMHCVSALMCLVNCDSCVLTSVQERIVRSEFRAKQVGKGSAWAKEINHLFSGSVLFVGRVFLQSS